jgi:hypothetical protein
MNVIQQLFDHYVRWVAAWQPQSVSFVAQLLLLAALPTLACTITFRLGNRSQAVQWLAAVVGVLAACSLSVERWLPAGPVARAWFVTLSFVVTLLLPGVLAFLLLRARRSQQILCWTCYFLLGVLLLASLFQKGASR